MNGLLGDYFPKGTDLAVHTAERLAEVATELNRRPRKTLRWTTSTALRAPHLIARPAEVWSGLHNIVLQR